MPIHVALLVASLLGNVPTVWIHADVEPNCQGDPLAKEPMPFIQWQENCFADALGAATLGPLDTQLYVKLESPYLRLVDERATYHGPWYQDVPTAADGPALKLEYASLSHTSAYKNFHFVREWAQTYAGDNLPLSAWLDKQVEVRVGLPWHCNAGYDPMSDTLNFFSAGNHCIDTARNTTVMYHEFGHAVMHHVGNSSQHSLAYHEGYADVIAALVSRQPRLTDVTEGCPLMRTCDNAYTYCKDGCTFDVTQEGHDAGQVICGVWWDLREQFLNRYGAQGETKLTQLFFAHLPLTGFHMDETYAALLAVDEDDDGDPSNGTQNSCEINAAYVESEAGFKRFPDLRVLAPCIR